jgi:hypothetical protein
MFNWVLITVMGLKKILSLNDLALPARATIARSLGGIVILLATLCSAAAFCALVKGSARATAGKNINLKGAWAMSRYDEAVKLLGSPTTWCKGAETLAKLGDPRAIVPLMHAFKSRAEGNKVCLYEAMDKLGGRKEARKLIIQDDAEKRLLGVRLMELFASDEHLPSLEAAARADRDEGVRAQAIYTLGLQKQTPLWEALMIQMLESVDEKLRSAAIENLATRYTDSARKALRNRLPREASAELRTRIEAAIKSNLPR